ncbi:T9SS type A sorting domain-containing protein [Psychroflexus aestuariivivens]|uniref:T9SS type A sorting domain-containing protein n=1 Tax=Psychroflexus aestuariivivens TaxID=1795040 RepID=UPI000FD7CE4E|nr:T9SS type A sorting domain-containing protein [Psychroflexus aestuariivivens]
MKTSLLKNLTLILGLLVMGYSTQAQIISQYIETDSGTTPKGIEIWNNTTGVLDFSANNLVIEKGTNGNAPSPDFTLSEGTLAAGEVIVIGTSDLETITLNNGSAFYDKGFTFNGDDALVVKYGGNTTDILGISGSDPGSAWSGNGVSTANQNIQLLDGITTGTTTGFTDPSTRFETVSSSPSGNDGQQGFGVSPSSGSGSGPTLIVSNILSLDYIFGEGPSDSQIIELSGNDLDNTDVTVSVPTGSNFEISQSENTGYTESFTLTAYDGSATDVYVRLKSGLSENTYSDVLTISGGNADDININLEGEVMPVPTAYDINETFENYPETSSSYQAGTFLGILGNTWNYVEARGDQDITAETVTLRNNSSSSLNTTLSGGITDFEFDYMQVFSTDVNLEVYINGALVATVSTSNQSGEVQNSGNIPVPGSVQGSFTIEFKQGTGGGQVAIDNLSWNQSPIDADYTFENGTWTPENPEGVSTDADDIFIADGNAVFNADVEVNNLTVAATASLNIYDVLNLNGDLVNYGTLTFKSNASGTAQLAEAAGSTVTGDVTTERFIPAGNNNRRAFRFLTPSVTTDNSIFANWQEGGTDDNGFGTHITGSETGENGFDATATGNPSMFMFDNDAQVWSPVPNTDTDILEAGTSYRIYIRGNRTIDLTNNSATPTNVRLRATGELQTGALSPALSQNAEDFSFIANPYQSIVDFSNLNFSGGVNSNNLYVWDPNAATEGAYEIISSTEDQMLRPGQAFFVVNTAAVTTPSITFTQSAKNTNGEINTVFSNNDISKLNLKLYEASTFTNGGREADQLKLRFSDDSSSEINELDALKFTNPEENLATVQNNKFYGLEYRATPQDNEVLNLSLNQYQHENYVFNLDLNELSADFDVILYDAYTETEIVLNDENYSFSIDTSIPESMDSNRFQLTFDNTTLSTNNPELANTISLYPNPVKDELNISGLNKFENAEVSVFNMIGQELNNVEFDNEISKLNLSQLSNGVYLVKINTKEGSITKRIIKQ